MMETQQTDSGDFPYVYSLSSRNGKANGLWLILLVILLIASSAALITILFRYRDRLPANGSFFFVVILTTIIYSLYALYTLLTKLWTLKSQGYSVTISNDGLFVEGSHSLGGKLIHWQEIEKIKKVSFPSGLQISIYGEVEKLILPCDLEGIPLLLSLMVRYFEEKQPDRQYPTLFINPYRYVKLVLLMGITVITLTLTYVTSEMNFLILIFVIGIYWLIDIGFIQKITLTNHELILHKPLRAKYFPLTAIKRIQILLEKTRNSPILTVMMSTADHPKPFLLETKGIDPTNLYLALHQAWEKAKSCEIPSNLDPLRISYHQINP